MVRRAIDKLLLCELVILLLLPPTVRFQSQNLATRFNGCEPEYVSFRPKKDGGSGTYAFPHIWYLEGPTDDNSVLTVEDVDVGISLGESYANGVVYHVDADSVQKGSLFGDANFRFFCPND